MSVLFDRLLCDPDEAMLVEVMEQAAGRSGVGGEVPGAWDALLDAVATEPEGRTQLESFSGSRRYLVAAWWTDHPGRKHIRVAAGTVNPGEHDLHYFRLDDEGRPPLWHICPGRLYRVWRGGAAPEWLAACACGEVGPPRALGWAGDCCGPCHDRREEGDVTARPDAPGMLRLAGPVHALDFSPRGDQLAVSSAEGVSLHDLRAGTRSRLHAIGEANQAIHALRFSPDGAWLAGCDEARPRILVWPTLQAGPPTSLPSSYAGAVDLAFSPDDRFLASRGAFGGLRIWRRPEWQDVYLTRPVTALGFAPDGRTLALGWRDGTVRLLETGSWAEAGRFHTGAADGEDVLYLEYTPGGDRLVLITGREEPADVADRWQLLLWDAARKREVAREDLPFVSQAEMTPDGRYLAWLVHDDQHSPAPVYFWDLQAWRPAGWLEWDSEDDLRCLAFAPDGETMATGSASGVVKLWPWRRLLEGQR